MKTSTFFAKMILNFARVQMAYGTLGQTLRKSFKNKNLTPASEFYFSKLLERKSTEFGTSPFLYYQDKMFTYQDMNNNANRMAHALMNIGLGPEQGIGIMTGNSPVYYDLFYGAQKLGMCAVPMNTNLRAKGLAHILNNSKAKALVIHPELLEYYESIADEVESLDKVIIDDTEDEFKGTDKGKYLLLSEICSSKLPSNKPAVEPKSGTLSTLMYTSGTTGLPKGVVYRHGDTAMSMIEVLAKTMVDPKDVMYTCLPLYHANALFVTSITAMCGGASVALDKRFSASRFWDRVRFYNVTTFNLLGAMIPILLKQPAQSNDRDHKVQRIITSACPADLWTTFESRFGVEIWEAYGAVDGGGMIIMNVGNAPKGSIGKPIGGKIKIIKEDGDEAKPGEKGELLIKTRKLKTSSDGSVEYFQNEKASSEKIKSGWIRTGDFVYTDKNGYIFFSGRDSETVRRRGENVSTYEVEIEILNHKDVKEAAVYGVPAELGEDEIMACLTLVEGHKPDVKQIINLIKDKIPYYAVPRYWRFVEELPKTGTHRVIKSELQKLGIAPDTIDAEKEGLMPKRAG